MKYFFKYYALNAHNLLKVNQNIKPSILKKAPVIKTAINNPGGLFAITFQEYSDRGNAKIEQQDYEGAIAYFSRAIEISPNRWIFSSATSQQMTDM